MATITIYRVEHPTSGLGPYQHYDWQDLFALNLQARLRTAHQDAEHPDPTTDLRPTDLQYWNHIQGNAFCGFADPVLLEKWFDGFWTDLDHAGFEVAFYEVEECAIMRGKSGQIVFDIRKAVKTKDTGVQQ